MKVLYSLVSLMLLVIIVLVGCKTQLAEEHSSYREPTPEEVEFYSSAFRGFGYEPEEFDFYIYQQADDIMSPQERADMIAMHRPLEIDYVPVFFEDKEEGLLYVLTRDDAKTMYLTVFQRNPEAVEGDYEDLWVPVSDVRPMEYRYEFDPD